jgi:RimJ/RimL family protein N-acetyltransferase
MESPIYMRPLAAKDFSLIATWLQDKEFLATYDYVPPNPMSLMEIVSLWMRYLNDKEVVVFALCEKSSDSLIGWLGFDEWDRHNKVATLFIGIGNRTMRGKGYGKQAVIELLRYGFNEMKLYRAQLLVLPFNLAGVKLYEGVGFVQEGVSRQMVLRDDRRYDLLHYGLLREEWEKREKDI